jgi:tetratricopeptide (TPR) repeat protein
MKSLLLTLLPLITPVFLMAQMSDEEVLKLIETGSEQELISENSRMTQEGLLYHAEMVADKLLTYKPESSNYNYRKGFLVLEIRKDYLKAIPYLEKAILNTDQNYDAYGISEKSAPTDAFFHLATCYHLDENIDKAKEYYAKFIAVSTSKSELVPKAKLRLAQCDLAKEAMANPVNVYLKNVGNVVNNEYPDYAPVISLDGTSLYYTSRRPWENGSTEIFRDPAINQYPEDVYVSFMNLDSTWTPPIRLDFCLPKRNEATIAVSTDERRIYLYEDSTGAGDIYYTDFYASKFQDIQKISDKDVNTKFWETHCMVSHDKSRMFFSSDRPGGYGGRDIYMSRRKNDSTWSDPVNLGAKVNTAYDEDSPFVSVDNKMLYFSSNGDKSIGGFDIMVCDLLENGTWSESRNLGYPFNSCNDDIFYTTTVDGLRGYMTSFRKDGFGEKDIYEIHNDFLGVKNLAVFKGTIKTTDGTPLPEDFAINVKLTCDDCEDYEKNRTIFPRLRDGMFMTGLKPCKTYKIAYFNATDSSVMYEESFTTKCDLAYQEIIRELLLDAPNRKLVFPKDTAVEIPPVDVVSFKNLEFIHYFDYNKNKLFVDKGKLKDFVKEVEKQLKEGRPAITINVYSSASHVPTKTYETNEKLTNIRAENMKYDLQTFFDSKPEYKGKVNVVIVSAVVDGPEYVKDFKDQKKYKPYQFVGLKTE